MPLNKSYIHISLILLMVLLSLSACTSARWTVKDKTAVDRQESHVLESEDFLSIASPVTPENPSLQLQVQSKTTYEYPQKVLAQRTIQDYKLKPGFIALGIIGGGLAAYAANSGTFSDGQSSAATFSLNVAAVLMTGSGFMNMKPVGEPRPTGEERFLRTTGYVTELDTLAVDDTEGQTAIVDIRYGTQRLVIDEERPIEGGELNIGLGGLLSNLDIRGEYTEDVGVQITFNDSTYTYRYPLEQVLRPYARVITPVTELRNAPQQSEQNILAELVEGSQLEIIETIGTEWYRILYGISENYINQQDVELIWRPSDFSEDSEVVAVPVVPFGNIDVENNIPILSGINRNAYGLIISNENYERPFPARSHAHRDALLINAYLENSLGFQAHNITELQDIRTSDPLFNSIRQLRDETDDSSQVIIYVGGYGTISDSNEGNGPTLNYLPAGQESDSTTAKEISLEELFRELATIPSNNMLVLADIEFRNGNQQPELTDEELSISGPLQRAAAILTNRKSNASVIFGSQINQQSELYVGDRKEDKKHHLLPYFFARALQERNTSIDEIYQFLQRNIPYTARRLHDRSQDPQLYGNPSLELIPSQ